MSYCDDLDDRPTRAECEWEAEQEEARAELEKEWNKDNPRKADILECARKTHRMSWRIVARLQDELDEYIESNISEWISEARDAYLERTDPYRYYGVNRRDFL